jgi:hypothetical protein
MDKYEKEAPNDKHQKPNSKHQTTNTKCQFPNSNHQTTRPRNLVTIVMDKNEYYGTFISATCGVVVMMRRARTNRSRLYLLKSFTASSKLLIRTMPEEWIYRLLPM